VEVQRRLLEDLNDQEFRLQALQWLKEKKDLCDIDFDWLQILVAAAQNETQTHPQLVAFVLTELAILSKQAPREAAIAILNRLNGSKDGQDNLILRAAVLAAHRWNRESTRKSKSLAKRLETVLLENPKLRKFLDRFRCSEAITG
jgi:hypothetical protein